MTAVESAEPAPLLKVDVMILKEQTAIGALSAKLDDEFAVIAHRLLEAFVSSANGSATPDRVISLPETIWNWFIGVRYGADYVIETPEFESDPYEQTTDELSFSLALMRSMLARLQQLPHSQPNLPDWRTWVRGNPGVLGGETLFASRPSDDHVWNDSGWRISSSIGDDALRSDADITSLGFIPVTELITIRSQMISMLPLPYGPNVYEIAESGRVNVFDAEGELLHALT